MSNIDRAVEVIGGWIDAYLPHSEDNFGADEDIARALADEGLLRPPASERYDSTMDNLPSFSVHEGSPVDSPHIEASVERRYRKGAFATVARVYIDLDGEHGTACIQVDTNSEWCRAAASILLDVADALDTAKEKE